MARAAAHNPLARGAAAWQRAGGWRRALHGWAPWLLVAVFGVWAAVARTDQFVIGLIVGSLYALAAVGLTLIYGIARVPHFAHGDAMMFSAYLALFALTGAVVGSRTGDVVFPLHLSQLPGATDPHLEVLLRLRAGPGDRDRRRAGRAAAAGDRPVRLSAPAPQGRRHGHPRRRLPGGGHQPARHHAADLGRHVAPIQHRRPLDGDPAGAAEYRRRPALHPPGGGRAHRSSPTSSSTTPGWVRPCVPRPTMPTWRAPAGSTSPAPGAGRGSSVAGLTAAAGCLLALQSQLSPELGFHPAAADLRRGHPRRHRQPARRVSRRADRRGRRRGGGLGSGIIAPGYKLAVVFVVLIAVILLRPRGLFGEQT